MTVQEPIEYLEQHGFIADEVKDMCIKALVQVEQYRALGTVEDLKEAKEKQIPKKPKVKPLGEDIEVECPACGHIHIFLATKKGDKFCNDCGQAIDWEEGGTSD